MHSQLCVVLFVSSIERHVQSLTIDSTRRDSSSIPFARFSNTFQCYSLLDANYPLPLFFLLRFPLAYQGREIEREKKKERLDEIHVRRCILEQQFPGNVSSSFLWTTLERTRNGLKEEKVGSGNLRATGFRSSFVPRSYGSRSLFKRTAQIEISRLDTSSRYTSWARRGGELFSTVSDIYLRRIYTISPLLSLSLYLSLRSFLCKRWMCHIEISVITSASTMWLDIMTINLSFTYTYISHFLL